MSKKLLFVTSLFVAFFVFFCVGNVFGVEAPVAPLPNSTNPTSDWSSGKKAEQTTNQESFSDYYHFGSVKVEVQSLKASYLPKEKVQFQGKITNTNEYPLLNGEIYARILQENKTGAKENGDFVVDEFFVMEKIFLAAGETKEVKFEWSLPQTAMAGNYKLATFFTVEKKYNISGLSFSSNIFGSFCSFQVASENNSTIFFDRNNVKFNNNPYLFRAFIPQLTSKDKANIVVPVNNTYSSEKEIKITYDLYYWDGLLEQNKIKTTSETITVPANSQKNIEYTLDNFTRSVYFLKITAQSGTDKSIIHVRFGVSDISEARINFIGVTKFPLEKGEKAKVFVTFHSTSAEDFQGKVDLELKDSNGNILQTQSFNGPITGDVKVQTSEVTAIKNLNSFSINSSLYDKDGKVVDKASMVYNNNLPNQTPAPKEEKSSNLFIAIILFILSIIIITSLILKRKNKGGTPTLELLFLIGISIASVYVFPVSLFQDNQTKDAIAQTGAANLQQTIGPFNVISTSTTDSGHMPYFNFVWGEYLTVNYELFLKQGNRILSDGDTVCPGEEVEFIFNKDGEWYGTGKYWDSPSPYWVDKALLDLEDRETLNTFNSLPKHGCEDQNIVAVTNNGRYPLGCPNKYAVNGYAPLIIQNPLATLAGGSNINCSGDSCVVGNGTETSVTATINKTYFQQLAAENIYGLNKSNNERCSCSANCCGYYWYGASPNYTNEMLYQGQYLEKIPIESVTKTWNLKICSSPSTSPTPHSPHLANIRFFPNCTQDCTSCPSPLNPSILWEFVDDAGDYQTSVQIQIADNSSFRNPIDSGKIVLEKQQCGVSDTCELPGPISFNKEYWLRMKVWDSQGKESPWTRSPVTYKSPVHAYPVIDFSWDPEEPTIGKEVQFSDLSKTYGGNDGKTEMVDGIASWLWTFPNSDPDESDSQNPKIKFTNVSGEREIKLKITDKEGLYCEGIKKVQAKGYVPKWQEIIPW